MRPLPSSPRPFSGLRTVSLVAGLALVGWALGCPPSTETAPEVEIAWSVTPQPPRVGPLQVALDLTHGTTGEPIEGARIRLEGTMSHPGMTPVFGGARETAPGRYETSLDLTMGGDWILLVEATLADGRILRRQEDLPGVRTGEPPPGPGSEDR